MQMHRHISVMKKKKGCNLVPLAQLYSTNHKEQASKKSRKGQKKKKSSVKMETPVWPPWATDTQSFFLKTMRKVDGFHWEIKFLFSAEDRLSFSHSITSAMLTKTETNGKTTDCWSWKKTVCVDSQRRYAPPLFDIYKSTPQWILITTFSREPT